MSAEHTATPELEPHCGSWVVTRIDSGEMVCELFDRSTVERVNREKYRVQTALQYLVALNARLKAGA